MGPLPTKNLEELKAEFERCWPWLWASLCEFGPTHDKDQVWLRICTGRAFLWPGKNCVVLGEFIDHPIGFRSFSYWLQGGKLDELAALQPEIEEWAKTRGCRRGIGIGRDGWTRAMDGDWEKGPTTRMKWFTEPPFQVRQVKMKP